MEVDINDPQMVEESEVQTILVDQSLSDIYDAATVLVEQEVGEEGVVQDGIILSESIVPPDQDDIIIEETTEGIPGEISEHEISMEEEVTPVILGNEQVVGQQEEICSYDEVPTTEELLLEGHQTAATAAVIVSAVPETSIGAADVKVKVVEEAGELYHDKQVDELLNEPEHVELSDNSPSEILSEGDSVGGAGSDEDTTDTHRSDSMSHQISVESKKSRRRKPTRASSSHTSASKLFLCPYCDLTAYNLEMIHDHIKQTHPMTGKFRCKQCTYASDHKFALDIHSVVHTTDSPYKCSKCSFKCNMDFQLNKHINLHTGEKHFKCNQCNYGTDHTTNFRRHMERHTRTAGTACHYCTYSCFNTYQLEKHIKRSHPNQAKKHGDLSNNKLSRREKSQASSSSKSSGPELPPGVSLKRDADGKMSCMYCNYKTAWHTNLKRHYTTHEPKKCHYCSFTSQDKTLFIEHLKRHDSQPTDQGHASSDTRLDSDEDTKVDSEAEPTEEEIDNTTYTCAICNFTTTDSAVWVTHQRRNHREQSSNTTSAAANPAEDTAEDASEEPQTPVRTREVHRSYSRSTVDKHFCPHCDFSCNHESWLVTHMRQHASGKTDHKCSFCAYTAPNPHRLKAHMMTHTGFKPYKCPRCSFASSNSSNLYRHIRKKHDPDDVELAKKLRVDDSEPASTAHEEETQRRQSVAEEDEETDVEDLLEQKSMALTIHRCKECDYTTTNLSNYKEHKHKHKALRKKRKVVRTSVITVAKPWSHKMEEELARAEKWSTISRPCSLPSCHRKKICRHVVFGHSWQHSCIYCLVKAKTPYQLRRHLFLSHDIISCYQPIRKKFVRKRPTRTPTITYICERCGFETESLAHWGKHLFKHGKEQLKQLEATLSQRKTKFRPRNSAVTTNSSDNTFSCNECDFICRRKDMYVAHMKQHSKKTSVSKCDQCPYTTSNPYNLMKHKRTHTGEKPFVCSYCPYRSADSGNLNKHINSHHSNAKSQVNSLPRKKSFKSQNKQSSASKPPAAAPTAAIQASVIQPPPNKPPKTIIIPENTTPNDTGNVMQFKCTECDYTCLSEEFLVVHLSIHRKQGDQYVCAICHYASRNQQNLAKHIRTHTGEKPYKCTFCSYSAADKGNLNKHLKTHHKNEIVKNESSSST